MKANKKTGSRQTTKITTTVRLEKNAGIKNTLFPFLNERARLIFLMVLTALLYVNTFWGDYVLDDIMYILNNKYVLSGFSGISKIFTTDTLSGFVDSANDLAGGRYRPFALMSFAVENGLWGNSPHISHLINITLFIIISFLVYTLFIRYFLKNNPDVAFISALIFIIHPIHTEVVANLKSRDELFSLLFLIAATLFLFRYVTANKKSIVLYLSSIILYFLALLSKENGVTFILLFPLMLYFFSKSDIKKIIRLTIPFLLTLFLYLVIRFSAVGMETHTSNVILNNPFLNTTFITKHATIMIYLLKYIQLLFFPYPQSYDYSYNQIPITGFSNPLVWLSILIYAFVLIYSLLKIKSKNLISFSILFYLVSIFLVSNILIDTGAFLGERFLFQPSLGFSIFIGYITVVAADKIKNSNKTRSIIISGFLIILVCILGFRTIKRNHDWRNALSLFLNDVKVSPNSAVANNFAGVKLIEEANKKESQANRENLLSQSIPYFNKASEILPTYPDPYTNAAIALIHLNRLDEADTKIKLLKKADPIHPKINELDKYIAGEFYKLARKESDEKDFKKAVEHYEKAVEHDSSEAQYWYDLAGTSCMTGNFAKGYEALVQCLKIKPDFQNAQMGLEDLKNKGFGPK